MCPQRHSKIYFQLLRLIPVTENPCTAVGRIILRSRIISGFLKEEQVWEKSQIESEDALRDGALR